MATVTRGKKSPKGSNAKAIALRLSASERNAFEQIARASGVTLANLARQLVIQARPEIGAAALVAPCGSDT